MSHVQLVDSTPTNLYQIRQRLRQRLVDDSSFAKRRRPPQNNAWLVSRWFDVLFVCGLAPWLFGLVAAAVVAATAGTKDFGPQTVLTTFYIAASLLIGESHQFTSIIRYYFGFRARSKGKAYKLDRIPFWCIYALTALVVVLMSFPAIASSTALQQPLATIGMLLQGAIIIFPAVLMQHVCAQAIAVGMIYCRLEGYEFNKADKRLLQAAMWTLVLAGWTTIAAPFSGDGTRNNLIAVPCISGATLIVLLFALRTVMRTFRTGQRLPLGAAILWTNLALFILMPIPVSIMPFVWLFVPVFFHATQHWAVAFMTKKTEARQKNPFLSTEQPTAKDIAQLVLPVLAVTIVVLFSPLLMSKFQGNNLSGINNTLGVFLSMLVFYVHYFADRVVWKPST